MSPKFEGREREGDGERKRERSFLLRKSEILKYRTPAAIDTIFLLTVPHLGQFGAIRPVMIYFQTSNGGEQ